jgi:hypothetical protein
LVDVLGRVCYNTYIATKEHTMRDAILAKLAEVDDMLMEATLDGEQLAEMDCFAELEGALHKLTEAVDYYVD